MKYLVLFILLLNFSPTAQAEVFLCDGKWTNKPCQGETKEVIKTTERVKNTNPELEKRKSLFHDLNMKNIKAKREFNVSLPLDAVKEYCMSLKSTTDSCEAKIDVIDRRLDEIISKAETRRREREKEEQEKNAQNLKNNETNNTVVIINNNLTPKRTPHLPTDVKRIPAGKRAMHEIQMEIDERNRMQTRERNNYLLYGKSKNNPEIIRRSQGQNMWSKQ